MLQYETICTLIVWAHKLFISMTVSFFIRLSFSAYIVTEMSDTNFLQIRVEKMVGIFQGNGFCFYTKTILDNSSKKSSNAWIAVEDKLIPLLLGFSICMLIYYFYSIYSKCSLITLNNFLSKQWKLWW